MLTQHALKEFLHYDPWTGIFTWVKRPSRSKTHPGQPAGSYDCKDGYKRIQFMGKSYRSHRLAFMYMLGRFPEIVVDHKNGNPEDNRWDNLREATLSENCKNARIKRPNSTGFRGVYKTSPNRWVCRPMHNGKFHYLGCFKTPEEANAAYITFCKANHGDFFNR